MDLESEQKSLASEQARQNRIAATVSNEMFAECQVRAGRPLCCRHRRHISCFSGLQIEPSAKAPSTQHRKELETERITLKTHQWFPTPDKFKNATIAGQFWVILGRKLGHVNDLIIVTSSFSKSSVGFQINKLTSVFYAFVQLLIMNFVITLSK